MGWGASAFGVLAGAIGGVLLVCAVVLAPRLGRRRVTAMLGGGLLLVGLSLSGVVRIVADALLLLSLNPVRWIGLATAAVGALLLSASGMLPGRRRRGKGESSKGETKEVDSQRSSQPAADDDLAEIEEILRRRGIQ